MAFSMPLDAGIAPAVKILRDAGIETYESCEGGPGHSFPEPTIRFYGGRAEGYRAAGIALRLGLPVFEIRRFWSVIDGELTGPNWEMTFFPKSKLLSLAIESGAMLTERSPASP